MIALFVRPATPGRTKTRLIEALGEVGAAQLYRAMACDVIAQAQQVQGRLLELWVAGVVDDPGLSYAPTELPRVAQPDTDLGRRMLAALDSGLTRHPQAMVLGSDAPGLDARELTRAFALLDRADVVLGPAADGGYTLIAARRTQLRMFDGVRFSSREALADTRRACLEAGLSVALASPWFDVDTPSDLGLLRALAAIAPGRLPHTAAALAVLDSSGRRP